MPRAKLFPEDGSRMDSPGEIKEEVVFYFQRLLSASPSGPIDHDILSKALPQKLPLELLYTDVWGPAPLSIDGFRYYVLFVDHFTKDCCLFPLRLKSDVQTVFLQLVEN